MKKQRVGLFTTPYSFFLYLLKFGYNKEDMLIFSGSFSKNILKNINHIQNPVVDFNGGPLLAPLNSFNGILTNIIGYIKYFYGYLKLRLLFFIKTFKKETTIYGHANSPFSFMFFENDDVNLIEDGILNYVPDIMETHKINPFIDFFLHLCGIYFLNAKETIGSHEKVKKVYLTRENNHPLIKNKVEVINIEECWNSKTEKEKKEILNIFNINYKDISSKNNDFVLLLTQPLSEDKLLSYDKELEIYKNIVNKFKNRKIILKPHPREKKDYSEIFPKIEIMDNSFPIELLNVIGFEPETVASVISNSLLNFKNSKIYIYDGELYSDSLKKHRKNVYQLLNNNNNNIN